MIAAALASIRAWVASLFSKQSRETVLEVLDHVSVFVDHALPIVEAIDKYLKPVLKHGSEPPVVAVYKFMNELGWLKLGSDELETEAARLSALPVPDLLANVAIFLLKQAKPEAAGLSILRLAVELAYNVYKGTRK